MKTRFSSVGSGQRRTKNASSFLWKSRTFLVRHDSSRMTSRKYNESAKQESKTWWGGADAKSRSFGHASGRNMPHAIYNGVGLFPFLDAELLDSIQKDVAGYL